MRTLDKCKDCETNKTKIQNMEIRLAVVESKVIKIEESIEKSVPTLHGFFELLLEQL